MGNPKAFLTIPRQEAGYRPVHDRINDFGEVEQTLNTSERKQQASRCMDCGVPFCHWACPLGNRPPEFQDALYKGKWKEAYEILSQTNDFPEFTGRICPALCEKSCVLKLAIDAPVTIREDEAAIIEAAFREGYIKPRTYPRNGKKVAVVGSGPAGMAAANQLNRMGYEVTVFEKDEYVGGLLRFGIPNFKLNKAIIDRRVDIMAAEGITFKTSTPIDVEHLPEGFDAYCICTGTPQARDLDIPGRDLKGIHFALETLAQQSRVLGGQAFSKEERINAKGKHVLVIGGGDTGNDCQGTALRQGCPDLMALEMMPPPPVQRTAANPWPEWPRVLKVDYGQTECIAKFGKDPRVYQTTVKEFLKDEAGNLTGAVISCLKPERDPETGRTSMVPTGKEFTYDCQLAFIAAGFTGCENYTADAFGVELTARGNVADHSFKTNVDKVFVCGDMRRGQSLVVWGLREGRDCAAEVDRCLMGYSNL